MRPAPPSQESTALRWAFLSNLFREVILPDKLVAPPKPDSRLELYRSIPFGAVTVVCLLLSVAFVTSLANNRKLLRDTGTTVQVAQNPPPSSAHLTADALQRMELLRKQLALLSDYRRNGAPWSLRWGLYSGNEILPDVRRVYFAEFRRVFLTPVLDSLVQRFQGLNPGSGSDSYDDIYERLKAYRTVSSGACAPDPSLLTRVLPEVWLSGRSLDSQQESLARRQISFYVSELSTQDPYERGIPEDTSASKQAQAYLLSFKGPEQILRGLIAAINQPPNRSTSLAQYAPDFAEVLTGPSEVPASFTRQGWDLIQARIRDKNFSSVGESCVVGGSGLSRLTSENSLQTDVQNLYVKAYIRAWRGFLGGQGVAPYNNVSDAVRKLDLLSGNRSPLLAVLLMIADNTNFPAAPATGTEAIRDKVEKTVQKRLGNLLPGAKKQQDPLSAALPQQSAPQFSQTDISNVFQPIRTLINPGNRDRMIDELNRPYVNALADLKAALDALPRDRDERLDVSMNNQARQSLDKAHAAVRDAAQHFNITSAQGTDIDLTRFLEMPIDFAEAYVPKDPRKPLRDKVNAQLRVVCGRLSALERKFPFNPQADLETTPQDLASVFAPGVGALWSFQQLPPPLAALLIKQGDMWMQNPAVQDPRLTPEFIEFFNRLAAASAALFPDDSAKPRLQYTVQPLVSEGVQAVRVNIGGTIISSTDHPIQISWPPSPDSSYVDLQLTMNGLTIPFGRYEGQWAIFRMMQDGEAQAPGSHTYLFRSLRQGHGEPQQVTNAEGNPVAVRLVIDFPGAFDPRKLRARCPLVAAQ